MKVGIYLITSPKGKKYVGQSVNIEERFKTYRNKLNTCKSQRKLYNSLKKYGTHSHIFKELEKCNLDKLNERERFWQDFYKVTSENGLNCRLTETVGKSGTLSKETKTRISNSMRGVKKSNEHRRKIAISKTGISVNIGEDNPAKRDDVRKKMSDAKLGKPSNNRKAINRFNKEGILIGTYNSINIAQESIGITGIGNVLKGRSKTAGGSYWKYKT